MKKIILIFLISIFIIPNTLASWDIYNMYSLPNATINTSTWYSLAISHIDWGFYINDTFLNSLIIKLNLTFLFLVLIISLSLKVYNQWKK